MPEPNEIKLSLDQANQHLARSQSIRPEASPTYRHSPQQKTICPCSFIS